MQTLFFPVVAIFFCVLAYLFPALFIPPKELISPIINYTLGIIMLSMGLSLNIEDFKALFRQKKSALALGVVLQFSIMPLAAWVISHMLGLNEELSIGMMLVGTAAGGTASNVISYLAKGDLSLSVSMTLASTLLGVVLMPFLTWLYLGESIKVDAYGMFKSLVQITLIPIALGTAINTFASKFVNKIQKALPIISMVGIISLISIIIALNEKNISSAGIVIVAVIAHNIIGMVAGYTIARAFKFDSVIARTIAIEVGMQNSGLSIALAKAHFASKVLATLPGAIFSIWHNISGAIFAGFIARKKG